MAVSAYDRAAPVEVVNKDTGYKLKPNADGSINATTSAPVGGATETKQDTQITALALLLTELQAKADLAETQPTSNANINITLAALRDAITGSATPKSLTDLKTALDSLLTELQGKADLVETQPISAAALPLPSGAATGTKQDTGNTSLGTSTDAEVTGDGSIIAILKRIRTLLGAATPAGNNNIGDVDIVTLPSGTVAAATVKTFDLDSGAGTDTVPGFALAVAASGGAVALPGDTANGLDVDVTRLPAIPAGNNNIGDVDVLTLPAGTVAGGSSLPAGTNNIGDVDVLTLPALVAGTAIIGKVGIDQTTPGTTNGVQVNAALPAGNNNIGDVDVVSVPAITKGAQGSTGLTTQDLKDAGRTQVMLSWEEMAGTAAGESSLTNFTLGSKGGSALSAATNYQVTAGKTLRIQSIVIYVKATSTVTNLARFRIRMAASILNSSPLIFDAVLGGSSAGAVTAGASHELCIPIPDGLEVAAGQQIAFTWFTSANTCTIGMSIMGYEY